MSVLLDALKKAAKDKAALEADNETDFNVVDQPKGSIIENNKMPNNEDKTNDAVASNYTDSLENKDEDHFGSEFDASTKKKDQSDKLETLEFEPGGSPIFNKNSSELKDSISEKLSSSKKIQFHFSNYSSQSIYKLQLWILLLPVLFFLIIFYTAIQWYSVLDNQFENKMHNFNINNLFSKYKQYDIKGQLEKNTIAFEDQNGNVINKDKLDNHNGLQKPVQHLNKKNVKEEKTVDLNPIINNFKQIKDNSIPKVKGSNISLPKGSNETLINKSFSANKLIVKTDIGVDSNETVLLDLIKKKEFNKALDHINSLGVQTNKNLNILKLKIVIIKNLLGDYEAARFIETLLNKSLIDKGVAVLYAQIDDRSVKPDVLKRLIELFPNEPILYLKLSELYLNIDPMISIDVLEGAAQTISDYYIFYNLAQLYKEIGDLRNYQKNMVKAILLHSHEKDGVSNG